MKFILKTLERSVNFSYSTPTPTLLRKTLGNSRIVKVIIGVDTPFDSDRSSMTVKERLRILKGRPQTISKSKE